MATSLTPSRQPRRTNPVVATAGAAGVVALLVAFGAGTSVLTDVFGNSDSAPAQQAPGLTVPGSNGGPLIESPCFRGPLRGMPENGGGVPMCTITVAP
jgi:hypothetical protein